MKKLLAALLILFAVQAVQAQVFNRAPLEPTEYAALPLGAIRPEGWLREQLQRQATGLTGHLDEVYPQVVGPDNAWLGGDGDAWERGPYWIDGLLPLAYILDDSALKVKANQWVEAILASQQEDGYMGPATDHAYVYGLQRGNTHDWWPKMVALKILQQHCMATGDPRVIPFLLNYFRYQAAHLAETPLNHWTHPEDIAFYTETGHDAIGEDLFIELVPYGCTTLRITEFPTRLVPWDLEYRLSFQAD